MISTCFTAFYCRTTYSVNLSRVRPKLKPFCPTKALFCLPARPKPTQKAPSATTAIVPTHCL